MYTVLEESSTKCNFGRHNTKAEHPYNEAMAIKGRANSVFLDPTYPVDRILSESAALF